MNIKTCQLQHANSAKLRSRTGPGVFILRANVHSTLHLVRTLIHTHCSTALAQRVCVLRVSCSAALSLPPPLPN